MAVIYNLKGAQTVQGTSVLDRYYAFTWDGNFDHVLADAVLASLSWTTAIRRTDGSRFTIAATNINVSQDVYFSNGGTDVLYASNQSDAIFYNSGAFADGVGGINGIQQFWLAAGDDVADFSAHGTGGVDYAKQVLVHGEGGNDTIIGGANNDELFGESGNDVIIGNAGGDTIDGGDGDDALYGDDMGAYAFAGQDVLRGRAGNDTLYGGARSDRLEGGDDDDTLHGELGSDTLYGGNGNDTLYGDDPNAVGADDSLFGEAGNDQLFGGGSLDQLDGGSGDDLVDGGDGDDVIKGGFGVDRLIGRAGNDRINGGSETGGGLESDTVVYSGNRSDYVVSLNPDASYSIVDTRAGAPDGSDLVWNVEYVQFADQLVAIGGINYPPTITSNGGGATAAVSVAENGTAVATVTATDPDAMQTLRYAIFGGADAALFVIDAATGALAFAQAPDFEKPIDDGNNNVYNVTVQVSDGNGGIDSQAIAVTVTNLPDGASPVITSNGGGAAATVTTAENQTTVTTVLATDPDGTRPSYSIVGGADAALFALDTVTGMLTFRAAPDFERPGDADGDNVYEVIVEASDGTNADRQSLSIAATNLNDNAPTITSNGGAAAASISLDENTATIATVVAVDPDGTQPTYAIGGGADAALFLLDATSGALTFKSAPDFEAPADADGNNIYEVVVRASDGVHTNDQSLAIAIANINDNAPVITSNGGGATGRVDVAENQTAVTTVVATDRDGSPPTYTIAGGADAAQFLIDALTGVLIFKVPPDFETADDADRNNSYEVIVQASDGANSVVQALSVVVTDVSDTGKTVTGTSGNDSIHPAASGSAMRTTALNDTIYALDGADTIDGGGGNDRMEGGAGNDVYYVGTFVDDGKDSTDDLVIEAASGGTDRVNASVTYRLPSEVENLTLTGTAAIDGYGNVLNNSLAGNASANSLWGEGGNDTLAGNDGNDALYGGDGNDTLAGGSGSDALAGGIGLDKLDGGIGADRMEGGAGDDAYFVDTYSDDGVDADDDMVIEIAGGGIADLVNASVSYRLAAEVERLTLTGGNSIDGTGNNLPNVITGNGAANVLVGLDGNDTLKGLAGADRLDGGLGIDTLDGGADADILNGDAAGDTLIGGAGTDLLTGGTGKDVLTGGSEGDIFRFAVGDTALNLNNDRITDFASGQDVIDIDVVIGALAPSAYAEGTSTTSNYSDALSVGRSLMTPGVTAVFVAGPTGGWLFWDGNGDATIDQPLQLDGLTSTAMFDVADII